ncbi:unnamed protein product [Ceutorhynchus assimilis]|uniref:YqaJ viral recombinase domain-containing protein n=1 Tax=Ceutorhynchus assimilis TaxID=467358 RepID=A0A9N9QN23_9CUCU|nr:unnamed protein product [Ceutorhynchus assimilis]
MDHGLSDHIEITITQVLELRTGIESALKYYIGNNDISYQQKLEYFRKDLENSTYHIFGKHDNCVEYFCKIKNSQLPNLVTAMSECGLLEDIKGCVNRLKFHSESLMKNLNNNSAEYFNALVAKLAGGKRINFFKRGGYSGRCFAAATSYNSRGNLLHVVHKKITGRSPGTFTTRLLKRRENSRTKVRPKKRKLFTVQEADAEYGLEASKPKIEIESTEMEKLKDQYLEELRIASSEEVFSSTINQSLSQAWFLERRKRLTASNFGRICNLRATTDKQKVAKSILSPTFQGNRYTEYGIANANELKAIAQLEQMVFTKINKSGLFVSKDYPFLAASPDGLLENDGLVEIKCPFVARNSTPEQAIESKTIKFAHLENGNLGNDAVLDQNSESQDPAVIIVDDPQPEPIKMPPLIIIKKSQKLSIPRSTPFISAIPSTSTMQENFVPNTTIHTQIFLPHPLLLRLVRQNGRTRNACEDEIMRGIKKFLVKAKERVLNKQKSDEVLNLVANKLQDQGKYSAFGRNVATELQELYPEMAIHFKKFINEAIFRPPIGKLNETSKIVIDRAPTFLQYDHHARGSLPIETEVRRSRVEAANKPSQRIGEYTTTSRTMDTFPYNHQELSLPIETEVVRPTGEATSDRSLRLGEYFAQYNFEEY